MRLSWLLSGCILAALVAGCATPESKQVIEPFCYQRGDWEGSFEFFPDGRLSVTVFDNYLVDSEQFSGNWSISGSKIVMAWDGSSEEFEFDRNGRVKLPSDASKCPGPLSYPAGA